MAWAWIDELTRKVREMTGTMTSADYGPVLEANHADHSSAEAELKAARNELDARYVEFEIAGNKVGIQRLRKRVREAQERLRELEYARERLVAARDATAAAEVAADTEARWKAAEQLAARWQTSGEEIGVTLSALVDQAQAFAEMGRELRELIPEIAPDVRASPGSVLWSPGKLAREIDLQLWALSDGLLAPRSGGVGIGSPYQLRCGPDFKRRVHESIALAFKARPRLATPEPPEAA